jgi:hypothetical protein
MCPLCAYCAYVVKSEKQKAKGRPFSQDALNIHSKN